MVAAHANPSRSPVAGRKPGHTGRAKNPRRRTALVVGVLSFLAFGLVGLLRVLLPDLSEAEWRKHVLVGFVLWISALWFWETYRISEAILKVRAELEDQILEWRNRFWDLGDEKPPGEARLWRQIEAVGASGSDVFGMSTAPLWLAVMVLVLAYC